jgi:hypothetical protein
MKKRIANEQKPRTSRKSKLGLKKEILRNLSPTDLELIVGGIGCPVSGTHPPGTGNC